MLVTTSQVVVVILCSKLEEDPELPVHKVWGVKLTKVAFPCECGRAHFVFLSE